ncbi:MAG: hypothetical protein V3V49_14925 [Candidatus Krumholzibacteria bacterium]
MKRMLVLGTTLLALAAAVAVGQPIFGELYYNGTVVRTVIPPAATPQAGVDNLYGITGGVSGQLAVVAVVAVAPGAPGYHGGLWAFHAVTWSTSPYLLTSEVAVLAAQSAGDVAVQRIPGNDFKCPVQP